MLSRVMRGVACCYQFGDDRLDYGFQEKPEKIIQS